MWNATKRFNLTVQAPDVGESGVLGVWDGDKFVYTQDYQSWSWWNLAKLFWKYGLAPYRTQKLMRATIAKFLSLYEAPYFPFRSLTTRAYELELTYVTGQTGLQFLAVNKVSDSFYTTTFHFSITNSSRSASSSRTTLSRPARG